MIIDLIATVLLIALAGLGTYYMIPTVKHMGKKRAATIGERKPFSPDWGRLPVVKRTGSDEEGRLVETRRIVIGNDRYETRLIIDGHVTESRRFQDIDGQNGAEFYHDKLVAKNGADPNSGAAPDWAPTTAKTMHDLNRERRMELELAKMEQAQIESGETHEIKDVGKEKQDPKAEGEDIDL